MPIKSWLDPGYYMQGKVRLANGTWSDQTGPYIGAGSGELVSTNHNLRDLGKGDVGGYFHLTKTSESYKITQASSSNYVGDRTCWHPESYSLTGSNPYTVPSDTALDAQGTVAIANTTPTNSIFQASTFLGETLTDGVPHMAGVQTWRDKTLKARHAGGEYLNVEFGWLPFMSDLRNFSYAVKHSHDIIQHYRDGANKKIRRQFRFPTSISQSSHVKLDFNQLAGTVSGGSSDTTYTQQRVRKTWFSGAYQYYLPVGDTAAERFSRYRSYAEKLLGVGVTPETVWNVSPWSWAVDWKTDVGSVVHNISNIGHDGLVLQYGYLMFSQEAFTRSESRLGYRHIDYVIKLRLPATPFGFGVDLSSLSAKQISILVALGLSRG